MSAVRTVGEWRTTSDGRRIWWVTVLPQEPPR